jgi:hypothetical protein
MTPEDFRRLWVGIWEFDPLHYDYPEDANQENGNYENTCIRCNITFIGNKHRRECKSCRNKRLG